MLRRSFSLAGRATLIFVALYVMTFVAAIVLLAIENRPNSKEDHHSGPVMALAFAAQEIRQAGGRLKLDSGGRLAGLARENPSLWLIMGDEQGRRHAFGNVPSAADALFGQFVKASYTGQFHVPGEPRPISDAAIERRRIGDRPMLIAAGGTDPATISVSDSLRYYWAGSSILLIAWSVLLGIVGFGIGVPLIRRALKPVVDQVELVSAESISHRLREADAPRELLPLIRVFNSALDRLAAELTRRKRFITNLAHELRTPIALVRLRAENLESTGSKDSLLFSIDRLSSLVSQMLDLERLSLFDSRASDVDLSQLAADTVADLAPLATKSGYDLCLNIPERPVHVRGDPHALRRALSNLIANSITHAGGQGEIQISVDEDRTIVVEDEGPGVPDSAQPNLFEPFFRHHHDREGCGLGLHLAREIMRAHGGDALYIPQRAGAKFALRFTQDRHPLNDMSPAS